MIERKPARTRSRSETDLAIGARLYPLFRKHVPLEGPLESVAVGHIAAATGLKERRIRELARRFRANPVAEALAPQPKGPIPGTRRVSADVLTTIDGLAEKIYLKMAPPSRADAARQIEGLLIAEEGGFGFDARLVPSRRSIERILEDISPSRVAQSTMGSKTRTAHEAHPGIHASKGFLDLVQMDHTRADVILVDSRDRSELGRPWVTLLIEVSTRTILGFYVSFGDPSIFRCGRAIANAVLPKEPLLEDLGVEADYPMHGLFRRLHADHAAPHRAQSFRAACLAYGIDPDVRPLGPAHWGGHIERLIGTIMAKMRLLPGATGANATKRDGYDAGDEAAMTLDEFERWFVRAICLYHAAPHAALGGLAPAQVWASEAAGHGPLVSPGLDARLLTLRFLPWVERTVKAYGIQIGYRRYWHPALARYIGQKVMVHCDERTIQRVFPEIDGAFVDAEVVGDYPDVGEAEWEATRKQLRGEGRAFQEGVARAQTSRLIAANFSEVLGAKAKTREARQQRKRREREGVSHSAPQAAKDAAVGAAWVSITELGEVDWLKTR